MKKRIPVFILELHEQGLATVKKYHSAEAALIDILQKMDSSHGYREFGFGSLFDYACKGLGLSEDLTYRLIQVARKSVKIPALKQAVQSGELTLKKARRIAPHLTLENQREWIEKAKTLPQRSLEKEIVTHFPTESAAIQEKTKYVAEDRLSLQLGVSEKLMQKLKRVQDLESQRASKPVSFEQALEALVDLYLEKKDPVEKAERALKINRARNQLDTTGSIINEQSTPVVCCSIVEEKSKEVGAATKNQISSGHVPKDSRPLRTSKRKPIPALLIHQINQRDQNQCTHQDIFGNRCNERRWLHFHHMKEVSRGGENTLENLVTVCFKHHRMEHHS